MSKPFTTLAAAVKYGFTLSYVLQIEGIPVLFTEDFASFGASAPSGYTLDGSLRVSEGQQVGSEVDRQSGFGRGFDATFQFQPELSSNIAGYVSRPSLSTRLAEDLAWDETSTLTVESTAGFDSPSGTLHIGKEVLSYTNTTGTTFTSLTRGKHGSKARNHSGGGPLAASATDTPVFWRGRRVTLYAIPVDGFGRVHGDDILSDACLLWKGTIQGKGFEMGSNGMWTLDCRSLERILDEPFAQELSGKATLDPQSDPLVYVHQDQVDAVTSFALEFSGPTIQHTENEWQPFASLTGDSYHRVSEIRAAMESSWESLSRPSWLGSLTWEPASLLDGQQGTWRAQVAVDFDDLYDPDPAIGVARFLSFETPAQLGSWASITGGAVQFRSSDPYWLDTEGQPAGWPYFAAAGSTLGVRQLPMPWEVRITSMLRVQLDEGEAADVPEEGWIRLEIDDIPSVHPYSEVVVTPEGDAVWMRAQISNTTQTDPFLALVQDFDEAGGGLDVSIAYPFGWDDPVHVSQLIPYVMLCSGRGSNHATYDDPDVSVVGLDLNSDDVALGSFNSLKGGAWAPITHEFASTEETSLGGIVSGLLAVSSHALVLRSSGNGAALRFEPVDTGLPITAPNLVDLKDEHLVVVEGRDPVRPRPTIEWPNSVTIETSRWTEIAKIPNSYGNLQSVHGAREGTFTGKDPDRIENEGVVAWEYDVPGLNEQTAQPSIVGWIYDLFVTGYGAQVVEIDCVPWLDAQIGTLLSVDISHYAMFTRSTGTRGYTGLGRCLGRFLDLTSGVQTLVVLLDAYVDAFPLCPSAPIDSWDGSASDPTEIYVSDIYEDLFTSIGTGLYIVYEPGADGSDTAVVEISAIADAGGGLIRLTVESTTGSVTLTSDHYLTLPESADATAAQLNYMHTDSAAWWT